MQSLIENVLLEPYSVARETPKTHRLARPPPERLLLMNENVEEKEATLNFDEEEKYPSVTLSKIKNFECEYEASVTSAPTPQNTGGYIEVLKSPITTSNITLLNGKEEEFNLEEHLKYLNNTSNDSSLHSVENSTFNEDKNNIELLVSFNPSLKMRFISKNELDLTKKLGEHTILYGNKKNQSQRLKLPEISVKILFNEEDNDSEKSSKKAMNFYEDTKMPFSVNNNRHSSTLQSRLTSTPTETTTSNIFSAHVKEPLSKNNVKEVPQQQSTRTKSPILNKIFELLDKSNFPTNKEIPTHSSNSTKTPLKSFPVEPKTASAYNQIIQLLDENLQLAQERKSENLKTNKTSPAFNNPIILDKNKRAQLLSTSSSISTASSASTKAYACVTDSPTPSQSTIFPTLKASSPLNYYHGSVSASASASVSLSNTIMHEINQNINSTVVPETFYFQPITTLNGKNMNTFGNNVYSIYDEITQLLDYSFMSSNNSEKQQLIYSQ